MTKTLKKLLKKLGNFSISLRIFVWINKAYSSLKGHKEYLGLVKDLYQLKSASILDWSNNNSKNDENMKIATSWARKAPKNDLLTLNYGLSGSLITLPLEGLLNADKGL